MISAENLAYWLCHPLSPPTIAVLRGLEEGVEPRHPDFDVAYLIALECVTWPGLEVTEKGREALEVFS